MEALRDLGLQEHALNNSILFEQTYQYKLSYNKTEGFMNDLVESFDQQYATNNSGNWIYFWSYVLYLPYMANSIYYDYADLDVLHDAVLTKQINNYKNSIGNGHGVAVVAHSQGNFFTNEAYMHLPDWMQDYFHMLGVATPADHVAGGGEHITFHDDPIHLVPGSLGSNLDNPDPIYADIEIAGVKHTVTDIRFHAFSYYMSAPNSREKILDFIALKKEEHLSLPSQWSVLDEADENSCSHKITLFQHRRTFDYMSQEAFPFNLEEKGKLYTVDNNLVRATCGGTDIRSSWPEQQPDECYLLDDLDEMIYQNVIITIGGKNVEASYGFLERKEFQYGSWAEGCPAYNKAQAYDFLLLHGYFMESLPQANTPEGIELGETLYAEVPEGFTMTKERESGTEISPYPAYDGKSQVKTNAEIVSGYCYGLGAGITYNADVYQAEIKTTHFERDYTSQKN